MYVQKRTIRRIASGFLLIDANLDRAERGVSWQRRLTHYTREITLSASLSAKVPFTGSVLTRESEPDFGYIN
jgi:hypothetical protein